MWDRENETLHNLRHTLAHLLASAVGKIYKFDKIKLTLGPAIENGFYYDIDFAEQKISEMDLKEIEKKMAYFLKQNLKFERSELPIDEGIKKHAGKSPACSPKEVRWP